MKGEGTESLSEPKDHDACGYIVSFRPDRALTAVKPQWYGYLNRTYIVTTQGDMPVWVGKFSQGPITWVKSYRQSMVAKKGKNLSAKDKLHRSFDPKRSALSTCAYEQR